MNSQIRAIVYTFLAFIYCNFALGQNQYDEQWVAKLYEHGVQIEGERIKINDEVKELIKNSDYRSSIHDNQRDWSVTLSYLQDNSFKKACWNLINLFGLHDYSDDKIIKILLTYDSVFEMDKMLVAAFYTYCYTDPEIGHIQDGKPVIEAPHLMEEKLRHVKKMIYYLEKYRADNSSQG